MPQALEIVTVDCPHRDVLKRKTDPIKIHELSLANEIAQMLHLSLKPHFPAAGLAAPQIGISKSVFIYSYDRDPKHLETVINPSYVPIGNEKLEEWEGCFSVLLSESIWALAKIPRHAKIQANYLNQEGEKVQKILEGFAAKVFQHECDHLQGVENIFRKDAIVKEFNSKEELLEFMKSVKKDDSKHYKKP